MKKTFKAWTGAALLACLCGLAQAQTPAAPTAVPSPLAVKAAPSHLANGLLDVNRATHAELTALGLSDAAADRVIQNRPYARKGQLLRFNALTPQEFWKIEGRIYAKTSTRGF